MKILPDKISLLTEVFHAPGNPVFSYGFVVNSYVCAAWLRLNPSHIDKVAKARRYYLVEQPEEFAARPAVQYTNQCLGCARDIAEHFEDQALTHDEQRELLERLPLLESLKADAFWAGYR